MRKYLIMIPILLLSACGTSHKIKGNTSHTVHTETHAEVVIKIDVSSCQKLPKEDQLTCITQFTNVVKDIKDVAQILICFGNQSQASGGSGVAASESCRALSNVPTQ